MEAARLSDEASQSAAPPEPPPASPQLDDTATFASGEGAVELFDPGAAAVETRIEEVVLCSGSGEALYDWQCKGLEDRLAFLESIDKMAAQIGATASFGRFERLDIQSGSNHLICQVTSDRRLFVRSSSTGGVA